MTSKAERKRRKGRAKAKTTLSDGTVIPQIVPNDPRRPRAEDPRKVVSAARMKRSGIKDHLDAVQPICGTDLGLCIRSLSAGDDFRAISETWNAISAAHRNYRMIYVGQTGNPKCSAIAMLPEPVETNQSLTVDVRTAEERAKAAKAAWAAWQSKIKSLPAPPLKWAIDGALNGFLGDGTMWRDAAPTSSGKTAVMALRFLAGIPLKSAT